MQWPADGLETGPFRIRSTIPLKKRLTLLALASSLAKDRPIAMIVASLFQASDVRLSRGRGHALRAKPPET